MARSRGGPPRAGTGGGELVPRPAAHLRQAGDSLLRHAAASHLPSRPAREVTGHQHERRRVAARRSSTALLLIGALVTALTGTGVFGPMQGTALSPVVTIFILLTLASVPAGIYLNRPARWWPWVLFDVTVLFFLLEYQARQVVHTGVLEPNPTLVPDLLALPEYLVLAFALTALAHSANEYSQIEADLILDGVIAVFAAMTVSYAFVVGPMVGAHHYPLVERLVLGAFPIIDVYLMVMAFRLEYAPLRRRSVMSAYVLGATAALFCGDTLYTFDVVKTIHVTGAVVVAPYIMAGTLLGAMALHPSMTLLSDGPSREWLPHRASLRVRVIFISAALTIPALIVIASRRLQPQDHLVVVSLLSVTVVLAGIRVYRALTRSARIEDRLGYEATHDPLTGLPNRTLVENYVRRLLAIPPEDGGSDDLAVLFFDLDRFKLINDTFGHTHGDLLLVEAARRLEQAIRENDMLARIGGDEFVIVIAEGCDSETLRCYTERVRRCFEAPFSVAGVDIFVTTSVGVSVTRRSDPMSDPEKIIRDADTAMYQAKEDGRDTVAVFDTSMRERFANRLQIEHDLRMAVERDELVLEYQPIVSLEHKGRIRTVGLEALIRWQHPTRGRLLPATFISIAEDTGMIFDVGAWVIAEACRQLADWQRAPGGQMHDLFVSVNLSPRQLRTVSLLPLVEGQLARYRLSPRALCLELTESVLMANPAKASAILAALRRVGVLVAIDDFGTGYSSLAYLKQFAVDYVKIDQSFINALQNPDTADETLVAAVIAMISALDSAMIAEGVEHASQVTRLRSMGCTMMQGNYYASPMPPDQVPEALGRLSMTPRLTALPGGG